MAKKSQTRRRDKKSVSPGSSNGKPTGVGDVDNTPPKTKRHASEANKKYKKDSSPQAFHRYKHIIAYSVLILCLALVYVLYNLHLQRIVVTPLDETRIIAPSATSAVEDPARFWGTYRSGLYFGLKTRSPHSPVVGLMWLTQFTGGVPPPVRHWCDQSDDLHMYGWFTHDASNFGFQEVVDKYYRLSTDFIKRPGGQYGGDWSARFRVNPLPGAEKVVISLFFYMALDGPGLLQPELKSSHLTSLSGYTEELGRFVMRFPKSGRNAKYNYLLTHANGLDQLKDILIHRFRLYPWDKEQNLPYLGVSGTHMPKDIPASLSNFVVHQVTVTLPFEMEVVFESEGVVHRPNELAGQIYQMEIQQHLQSFDAKFEKIFGLEKKGMSQDEIGFAKAILSNMLGSIGYFHGTSVVKSRYTKEPVLYWPASLFTAVPSRSFFPRGFLWDEGFHNLLISKWDRQLSMDIIGHWLDLLNREGWIPREQILGEEARAKVPEQFVVQNNENANPPALFLPLRNIVKDLIASNDPKDRTYLKHLFPRLKAWYNWYNTTQLGQKPFTYRWRGRNPDDKKQINPLTLTSGLDDYPRASHPTSDERHIDLRCWMALASGVMADIAKSVNVSWRDYQATHDLLTDQTLLDKLHWSEKAQRYSDYGLHTDHIRLERPKLKPVAAGQRAPPPQDKERVVKQEPVYGFVDSNFGYVSLFPFLLKILQPGSLKLGKTLQDLQDPNLLWTKYGLRSLAKNSPLYKKHNTEHDPPYWRGAIWLNMNYLTLAALNHYAASPGPYQETSRTIYKDLRKNLISNMVSQYKNTGYIWENYDDVTGKGKGTHPFTGWSALIVLIMAEEY